MPRFAVLNCYPEGAWQHGADLWTNSLREDGEEWIRYDCQKGEMPSPSEALTLDGIVLTGSPAGVYQDLPWIAPLMELVRAVAVPSSAPADVKRPQVIGGCFGHQVLGQALGGRVEPQGFFLLRAEELRTTPAFAALPFASSSGPQSGAAATAPLPASFVIIESHGDCVKELPPDSVLLASSASCQHEMMLVGRNCLGIQSHPEFTLEKEVRELLWPRNVEQAGRIQGAEAEESLESFGRYDRASQDHMLDILRRFIKRRY